MEHKKFFASRNWPTLLQYFFYKNAAYEMSEIIEKIVNNGIAMCVFMFSSIWLDIYNYFWKNEKFSADLAEG